MKRFQVLVALFYLFSSCSVENDVSQPIQTATPIQESLLISLLEQLHHGESVL
jgi:hypothetical protein